MMFWVIVGLVLLLVFWRWGLPALRQIAKSTAFAELSRRIRSANHEFGSRDDWVRVVRRSIVWLTTAAGWIIGVWGLVQTAKPNSFAPLSPSFVVGVFIALGLAAAIYSVAFAWSYVAIFLQTKPRMISLDLALATPSETASSASQSMLDPVVIGDCVEVECFPYLDRIIGDNGWEPSKVKVSLLDQQRSTFGGLFPLVEDPPNNPKYWLYRVSKVFADQSASLSVGITKTDWNTVHTTQLRLEADEKLLANAFVDPAKNPFPGPFCLHLIVQLRDGAVIVLQRSDDVRFQKGRVSISYEEQLAERDFRDGASGVMENWFQRALCEELFPLTGRYEHDPADAWTRISVHVRDMNVWSAIYEAQTACHALFGVVRLSLNATELVQVCRKIENDFGTKRDNEGALGTLDREQQVRLIKEGKAFAVRLFRNGESYTFDAASLHSTSSYRLLRLVTCMGMN